MKAQATRMRRIARGQHPATGVPFDKVSRCGIGRWRIWDSDEPALAAGGFLCDPGPPGEEDEEPAPMRRGLCPGDVCEAPQAGGGHGEAPGNDPYEEEEDGILFSPTWL